MNFLSTLMAPVRMLQGFMRLPLLHRIILGGLAFLAVGSALYMLTSPEVLGLFVGVVLLVAGLLWLINWFVQRRSRRMADQFDDSIASGEAVDELKGQWQRAVEELRSTGVDRYSMGFYLLIGEPQSGKSTTLRRSGLNFPIGMEAISGVGGTRNCDWWFTDEAVILDTAGRLTFQEEGATDKEEFDQFLKLLSRFRPRCPINGIIVTIPCTSLLSDTPEQREKKANVIREALVETQRGLQVQFPVYILITKADQVLGFTDFFARLKGIEQTQLFGWSRPSDRFKNPFRGEEVPEAMAAIGQRLNRWRMMLLNDRTGEVQQDERDRLFAFPDEFAALRKPLQAYMQTIFPESRLIDPLYMRGMYFTSGVQKGVPVAQACADMLSGTGGNIDSRDLKELFETERAFFIRDFYRKKVFREPGLLVPTAARVKRVRLVERIGYGVAAAAALFGVLNLTLASIGVIKDVSEPKDLVATAASLHVSRSNGSATRGQRIEQAVTALALLDKMARVPKDDLDEGQLAGFIARLERGETLKTIGNLTGDVASSDRENLRNAFANLYRWVFVHDVLDVLVDPICNGFQREPAGQLRDARVFQRYRRGLRCLLEVLGCGRNGPAPATIAPLLEFAREQMIGDPGEQKLSDQLEPIERCYIALRRMDEDGWLSRETSGSDLIGTGVYQPFLNRSDPVLANALQWMAQRWEATVAPDADLWLTPLDATGGPSEDVKEEDLRLARSYRWLRMYRLDQQLRGGLAGLGQRMATLTEMTDPTQKQVEEWVETAGATTGQPGASWTTDFARFNELYTELETLVHQGAAQPIAWEVALKTVADAYQADRKRFFELTQHVTGGTQFSRYIGDWKEWANLPVATGCRTLFGKVFASDSMALLAPGTKPDAASASTAPGSALEAVSELAGRLDQPDLPGQGVQIAARWAEQAAELRGSEELARQIRNLLALTDRTQLANSDWSAFAANDFFTSATQLFEDREQRLEQSTQPTRNGDDAPQEFKVPGTAATRTRLAQALKGRVLTILLDSYAKAGTERLNEEAASLTKRGINFHPLHGNKERSDPGREIQAEYASGTPRLFVCGYLEPLAAWATSERIPPLENGAEIFRTRIETLAMDYLSGWDRYWSTGYHEIIRQRLEGAKGSTSWPGFFEDVYKTSVDSLSPSLAADMLAAYVEQSCKGVELMDYGLTSTEDGVTTAPSSFALGQTHQRWRDLQDNWRLSKEWLVATSQEGAPGLQKTAQRDLTALFEKLVRLDEFGDKASRRTDDLTKNDTRALLTFLDLSKTFEDKGKRGTPARSIPALDHLAQFSRHARRVLSEEATDTIHTAWNKIRENQLHDVGFPFGGPGASQDDVDMRVLETGLERITAFTARYQPLLGLRPPQSRNDPVGRTAAGTYLQIEIPSNLLLFLEQCQDLREFLYGYGNPGGLGDVTIEFSVKLINLDREDRNVKAEGPYFYFVIENKPEAIPRWQANAAAGLSWSFGSSKMVKIALPREVTHLTLPKASAEGMFAILQLLSSVLAPVDPRGDHPSGVQYDEVDATDAQSIVNSTVRRKTKVRKGEQELGSVGFEFFFEGRPYPRTLPQVHLALWEKDAP